MTHDTDETDQRHRYECEPCDRRGPLRDKRDQAARDAQQHDVGFHDGTITCDLVAFEVATDGGEDLLEACPECDHTKFKVRVSSVHRQHRTGDRDAKYKCGNCGATFDEPRLRERRAPAPLNGTAKQLADAEPGDLLTDGGLERPPFVDPDVEVVECHFCHETWPPENVDGFDLSAEDGPVTASKEVFA